MHLHFEKNNNAKCDCNILSLSWMGKVPDELPEDEGWKLNRTNYYQEGWLATGNARGLVGVTFTTSHCRTRATELPLRANYNLRGHRSEVILVKWNEPYQKLASCDSSGVIFVWIKYEGRWSIELINDRSTPVTHFSWSHDGRMALICYRDGFVLVGSVAGQRYWSSMLNDKAIITCGIWTPDDQQVYFGTTAGQLIVMDVHGAMVSEVQLAAGVTSMAWSAEKFKMEEGDDDVTDERSYVLAVCLADGNIVMLRSFDDVSPITIRTNLRAPLHAEWSNSRKLLAIAGIKDSDTQQLQQQQQPQQQQQQQQQQTNTQEFTNLLKFYSDTGSLVYTTLIPYSQCPVSALTWGHNDRRLFVATGARVHAAWVSRRVGSLQLLARLAVRAALTRESSVQQLPLPPRLRTLVSALFASTIRCCVPEPRELRRFVSRPPPGGGRLHCTMLRHPGEPAPCYTLYLEYLGGLVPLLKGRRTSKIRPEFVIFDPQNQETLQISECASTCHSFSDSSDTERDTAELCGSPRNRRKNRRRREDKFNDTDTDDLAYVDTLPEHVRLVEVTSNIWGTKFKIHGLADSVPANLGQVTYRTSLLHLQPRQMTLVMTELRDDLPAGPDPSFNPNLFSEDEEETFQEPQGGSSRCTTEAQAAPPIAPMTPRNTTRLNSTCGKPQMASTTNHQFLAAESVTSCNETAATAVTATATASPAASTTTTTTYEDEFPYVDLQEVVNFCESVRTTNRTQSRYNVPRCCDVPTLQSPKNAVAPTQTLIATSNSNTDYSNNIQRMKTALASTDHPHTNISTKKEQENNKINQENQDKSLTFSSSIIPLSIQNGNVTKTDGKSSCTQNSSSQTVYLNGINNFEGSNSTTQVCLINNPVSKGTSATNNYSTTCQTQTSPSNNSTNPWNNSPTNTSPTNSHSCTCSCGRRNHFCVAPTKIDELRYIDDEARVDNESAELLQLQLQQQQLPFRGVHRTPTVFSIGPLCPNDSIVRSCSVGYLDLVDAQMVPCDVALTMLRKEAPNKRLVLVSRKTKRRRRNKAQHDVNIAADHQQQLKPPKLTSCGKSKSLDSSDLFPSNEQISLPPKLPEHAEEPVGGPALTEGLQGKSTEDVGRRESINDSDQTNARQDTTEKIVNENVAGANVKGEVCESPARDSSPSGSLASSLDGLAARLWEFEDSPSMQSSSRPSSRLPRSSPSSPAPSKKGKRPASASPIRRRLLSSPLLSRKTRKSRCESSDEERLIQDDSVAHYRDLETFQKAQLRQKLKQRGASTSTHRPEAIRRELVMHNKAPMWNESSQVYQLDFGGRVTQESAKNFQIEFRGKQVMQFGRIDGNAYTLDFQYPFSALQAFAVALANVTQRLK